MPEILPRVALLATGGTIAGAPAEGVAYQAGAVPVDALLEAVPGLDRMARLRTEQVAAVGSQNVTEAVWRRLAARVQALCDSDDIDAIVVTHGTDTMEETAYFLSLVSRTVKPIILTGAMRPSSALGADGPANIHAAVRLAGDPGVLGHGVVVVMNDQAYHARDIQKSAANGLCPWTSPRGACARLHRQRIDWAAPPSRRHTAHSEFAPLGAAALPRVGVLYSHADLDPGMLDAVLGCGLQGVVLAGVGDGNTSDAALAALARAARNGLAVVRATRTGAGAVQRNVEVDDDGLGFIAAGELNPQKARILLALALARTSEREALQTCFDQY